jgi:hypothetical protein
MTGTYLGRMLRRARGEMTAVRPAIMPVFAPVPVNAPPEAPDSVIAAPHHWRALGEQVTADAPAGQDTSGDKGAGAPGLAHPDIRAAQADPSSARLGPDAAAAARPPRAGINGGAAGSAESRNTTATRWPSHPMEPPINYPAGPAHAPNAAGPVAGDAQLKGPASSVSQHGSQTWTGPAAQPPSADGSASNDTPGRWIQEQAPPVATRSQATPAIKPATMPARPLPAAPRAPAHDASGGPQALREATADNGGTRPDVTISIGHIEVRAAPPIERPRSRPPFRPRVSLDDFLSQRQDRRR